MADLTGTIREGFGGKEYELRLTMRGIATLQDRYGLTLGGLLDNSIGDIPPFGLLLDLVSVSLQKGSKLPEAEADDLAEELLTADQMIVGRIIKATFPEIEGDEGEKK